MSSEIPRSQAQNKALHLFFTQLSEQLNSAGFDIKRTLRHDIDIPWNPELVKILIWKKVQDATLGKESTTKLDTDEVTIIYEIINRYTASNFGVSVPFPSIEYFMNKGELK